ncbi:arsenite efflux transporter metallochaperone ArsD [Lactococcus petauri]|uniref:arsenite efflux transporter metallochaperone ArsD n=1 Tax=Lactococcus petauri TaxID=1940789 RepID=UPI0038551DC5
MQKIEIFEPAMCCSTGVCGPSVDSELLCITNLMDSLKDNKEIKAYRYNLTSNPQVFVVNETILNLLQSKGNEILPVTMVDGTVIKTGSYPTITELQAHCETLDEVENNTCCDSTEGCCAVDEKKEVEVKAQTKGSCCGGNTGCC